jgi:hypothetical protein
MASLTANVRHVDGSLSEFPLSLSYLDKLHRLQTQGLKGKGLVDELLTSDWGAPPLIVDLFGQQTDGTPVRIKIPYE